MCPLGLTLECGTTAPPGTSPMVGVVSAGGPSDSVAARLLVSVGLGETCANMFRTHPSEYRTIDDKEPSP